MNTKQKNKTRATYRPRDRNNMGSSARTDCEICNNNNNNNNNNKKRKTKWSELRKRERKMKTEEKEQAEKREKNTSAVC